MGTGNETPFMLPIAGYWSLRAVAVSTPGHRFYRQGDVTAQTCRRHGRNSTCR